MKVPVETGLTELKMVLGRLQSFVYESIAPVTVEAWVTPEPVRWSERRSGAHRTLAVGDSWGGLFDCAWFRFSVEVPDGAPDGDLVLELDVSGELCVVNDEGEPVAGLTCAASTFDYRLGRPGKTIYPLPDGAAAGRTVEVWADAGNNDLFGELVDGGTVRLASLSRCRAALRDLAYDLESIVDWLEHADRARSDYRRVLDGALDAALKLPGFADGPEAVMEALAITARLLSGGQATAFRVDAIGHAHIDLAWLWPLRETRRKAARTFATALALMDRYPEYRFGMGQPQLYQWIKEDHPTLFERIRRAVAAGRIEPQGVTWVEADLNATGGESLVRQVLYGRRFFRDEFGVVPDYLWEPDAFGYPASVPQILAKSGVRYFGSQKMSWSDYNTFPHHSFVWRGNDGSEVLAHFFPEATYNGPALPRSALAIERDYRQADVSDRALMVFGIGDGGGGPGEEHLERLRRLPRLPGLPTVVQRSAQEFFRDWAADADAFPTWQGELYLERHQGTYTSQSAAKKNNRTLESLLRRAEYLASLAGRTGVDYPRAAFERVWKEVLLYQFHDILPGSSIRRVYEESGARYAELAREVAALIDEHAAGYAAAVDTSAATRPVVVVNTLSWDRREWIEIDGRSHLVEVPGAGHVVVDLDAAPEVPDAPSTSGAGLENDLLRLRFADDGSIASVQDRQSGVEYLREPGNALAVYHDLRDAWDFVPQYREMGSESPVLESSEPFVAGHEAGVRQRYRYRSSTLEIDVVLAAGSPRVEFRCTLDWREPERMLKVAFPLSVWSEQASCGIQFGAVTRPTHSTTTWDEAKDEVAARWVDVSDATHGVALLSDSKYGYRVKDRALELTLVRSPRHPGGVKEDPADPDYATKTYIDLGTQRFVYAVVPHAGGYAAGEVVRHSYELNEPLLVVPSAPHAGRVAATARMVELSDPAVVLETIKQAEDSEETVLRFYESAGGRRRVVVRVSGCVAARETNLVEEEGRALPVTDGALELDFGPFEVKTILVTGEALSAT